MQALRIAERCHRLDDVDAWLDEIDADAYAELAAYDQLQPYGWEADRIAIRRLSYMSIAPHAGKQRLRESDFDVRIGGNVSSDALVSAKAEAFAISQQIRADLLGEGSGDGEGDQ